MFDWIGNALSWLGETVFGGVGPVISEAIWNIMFVSAQQIFYWTYNHVAEVPRHLGGGFHSDFQ